MTADRPGADPTGATYRFDAATAVAPTGVPGRWAAAVDAGFSVGAAPNGGYLQALVVRAVQAEVDARLGRSLDPLAVSASYLAVAPAGPVEVDVTVLRAGRSTAVLRAEVHGCGEDADTYVVATVTCGTLPAAGARHRHDVVPPMEIPALEDCVRLPVKAPGFDVPLMGVLAEHLDPACLGWAEGRPSGAGELRAWVHLDDHRPVDVLAVVMAADCLPPPTFDLGLLGWVPTLQLSVWVRARPAPGPLRVRTVARVVDDGSASGGRSATVDESCDVWDAAGSLVATGNQLASLRLP